MFKKRKLPSKAKLRKRKEKEEADGEDDSLSIQERIKLLKVRLYFVQHSIAPDKSMFLSGRTDHARS